MHFRGPCRMLRSVVVVLMLLSSTYGQNPAVQVILTNKGLQYGTHTAAGWVQERLENVTLPDISGYVDILIGKVYYTLSGVTITKCDLPEPSVEFFQEQTGFKSSIVGLSVALSGDWRTHFGVIHDMGSFEMAIFSLSLTSVVELGMDPDGHLSVTDTACDADIGDLAIQFHGGASWIFRPFVSHFKGHIIGEIKSRLCSVVEESINNLEHHLQYMNVSFAVDQVLTLDLPLTDSPVIDASTLRLDLKGEFYSTKTHKEPPFEAQPFTMPQQPKYMLSVGLSEYTLNSASYGYFSAGALQSLISDSMVYKMFHVHLNTTSVGVFIPELPQKFPDLLMSLQVYAREAPMFSFQTDAVELAAQAAVKASAIEPNSTQIPLFTLNVDVKLSGKMLIADGKLKGSLMLDNLTLTLESSEIGIFKTDALEKLLNTVMKTMVLVKVNGILGKGIDLPRMKHAQLVNSVLKMEEGFIAVFSDAEIFLSDSSFYRHQETPHMDVSD